MFHLDKISLNELESLRKTFTTIVIGLTLLLLLIPILCPQVNGLSNSEQLSYNKVNSDLIWNIVYGSDTLGDTANSVIVTHDGGCVITGSVFTNGGSDVLLMRITDTGVVSWVQSLGGVGDQFGCEVIECRSGGYAIIGYERRSTFNTDALLIRCDALGQILWAERYGDISFEEGIAIIECTSGGFAFTGYSTSLDENSSDFWLVRTNIAGEQIWNQTFPKYSTDICNSLVETDNGGFILAGSTESYDQGDQNGWLVATDMVGNMLWNYTYGSNQYELFHDVIRNSNGAYIVAGTAERMNNSVAVLEFDSHGSLITENIFPISLGDHGYAITECHNGGYAVTGRTSDSDGNKIITNLLVLRLDEAGTFQWSKSYGGLQPDIGRSIAQATNGDFIVAGITQSYAGTQSDAWLIRLPDIEPPEELNLVYERLDIVLISFGVFLAFIVLGIAFFIYHRSRGELKAVWIKTSKSDLLKSALSPRFLEDLDVLLSGPLICRKCGTVHHKSELVCMECGSDLHRCMFCDGTLGEDEPIVFCRYCKSLAHHHHMQEWLAKRNFCPNCGVQLHQSSTRL